MMEVYRSGCLPDPERGKKNRQKRTSQVIYTFDIEMTSVFEHPEGWGVFRYDRDATYYRSIRKGMIPYIWMLGIEQPDGTVRTVFGRRFGAALADLFADLGDRKVKKVVWIHNLPFEFQTCLIDAIGTREIDKLVSRKARKPVRFCVPEWNIEFRCSFALTGLGLKKAAEAYGKHRKQSGDRFRYNELRTPLTHLTRREFKYCEADVVALVDVIAHYRAEYGKLQHIPLTATGEIRKELRKRVDRAYIKWVRALTPSNPGMFLLLMRAFQGGFTHGCYARTGKVIKAFTAASNFSAFLSADKASAYPADMLSYRFPMGRFIEISPEKANSLDRDKWAVLYHVTFKNIESKLLNNYILTSKAVSVENLRNDAGRLISADSIEMVLTEVDFDIIRRVYRYDEIIYHQTFASRKSWLPLPLLKYILDLYEQKTSLKGVKGQEDLYRKSKTRINGLFGCCCTNVIKGSAEYSDEDPNLPDAPVHWWTHKLTADFIEEELEKLRNSRGNCFAYQWGVWITAYCRKTTWQLLEALDPLKVGLNKSAVYSDTDSVKAPDSPELRAELEKLNKDRVKRLMEMCRDNDINPARLAPKDPKGKEHMIGLWEFDELYQEFKTLGPKRYAHRDEDGVLRITVSGVVSEKGRKALHNQIDNFRDSMVFDYRQCGKMISYYLEHQEPFDIIDREGNVWHETQPHGIALYPTTYGMGIDEVYMALWERIEDYGRIQF